MRKAYCTTNIDKEPGCLPLYVQFHEGDPWSSAGSIRYVSWTNGMGYELRASGEEWDGLRVLMDDLRTIRDNVYPTSGFAVKAIELLKSRIIPDLGNWHELRGEAGTMKEIACEQQAIDKAEIAMLEEKLDRKKRAYDYLVRFGKYTKESA